MPGWVELLTLFGHLEVEQPLGVHADPVGCPADQVDGGQHNHLEVGKLKSLLCKITWPESTNRDHHPLDDGHRSVGLSAAAADGR
jgi:hypothetical protein